LSDAALTPFFVTAISHAASNHTVSGVRVSWKIVPASTRTRLRQPPQDQPPAGRRQPFLAPLVNELVEAAIERVLSKTIARYGRVDLLCLDELGYMELGRRGAELLFQVLTEREETSSVAIASNESFSGWTKTFTDPRLCAAIVDRLTFGGNIIETGTTSYRLAHTLAHRAADGTA